MPSRGSLARCLARAFAGAALLLVPSCSVVLGFEEAQTEQACILNSDCEPNKVCIFRACSTQCVQDVDCPADYRCLKTATGNACVEASKATCDKTCPEGSSCSANVCRNPCKAASECLANQACSSGFCVGTDTTHDPGSNAVSGSDGGREAARDASQGGQPDGGSADDGGIVVGGMPCSMLNALSCAGAAQKKTLRCDGTQWVDNGDCPAGKNCDSSGASPGTCQPIVAECSGMVPGAAICVGTEAHTCGADLIGTSLAMACTGGKPACLEGQCVECDHPPDAQLCANATTPRTCDANGSWVPGIACNGATPNCLNGGCVGPCTNSEKQCSGVTPQLCVNHIWQNQTDCSGLKPACAAGACVECNNPPDSQKCAGNTPRTCVSNSWSNAAACSGAKPLCVDGGCVECNNPTPDQLCNGTSPRTCGVSGMWSNGTACSGLNPVCVNGACHECNNPAPALLCSGSTPRTCVNNSWNNAAACAGAKPVCLNGTCHDCDNPPASLLCADATTPRLCVSNSWVNQAACGANPFCLNGGCVPCQGGTKKCVTNSVQTCDGTGNWGASMACPLANPPNPICTGGYCAYHLGFDTPGGSDLLYAGFLYGVRFRPAAQTKAYRLGMFGIASAVGHNARMAIYSEGGNLLPNGSLATTATFPGANGAMEAPLAASITLTANTYYWIVAISDTDLGMRVTAGAPGYALNNNPSGWPILPATFTAGGSITTTLTPDFYVVLEDF